MSNRNLLIALPVLALATALAPAAMAATSVHVTDRARGGCNIGKAIGIGIGVGVGVELGRAAFRPRHCDGYRDYGCHNYGYRSHCDTVYVSRPVYVEPRTVYVDRPVYVEPAVVERPVYVDRVVEKPVERTVYVDRPVERVVEKAVERTVHRDREIRVENGKTTIYESVDGKLRTITHAPSAARALDADAEMALLCNIRDSLNRKLPMEVARVVKNGSTNEVEVILRATRFSPYDRATRRFVISAQKLTAAGSDLSIHFNADADGLSDLAGDFQDLLRKMGADCQAQGGDWFLDNQFNAEPAKGNGRPLSEVLAALNANSPK